MNLICLLDSSPWTKIFSVLPIWSIWLISDSFGNSNNNYYFRDLLFGTNNTWAEWLQSGEVIIDMQVHWGCYVGYSTLHWIPCKQHLIPFFFCNSEIYLSMVDSFYYDWTLAEAAKNAAQSYCFWVPKMKVLQLPQNFCKNTFPDWHRNEFGSNETYLSMFNIFYYDWTLAETAKNAVLPHCCWVPKMKVLQLPQNFCKNTFPGWCIGVSLVHIKHTYPCLTAFIMTEHWLKQPKCCPATLLLSAKTEGTATKSKLLHINLPWQVYEWVWFKWNIFIHV